MTQKRVLFVHGWLMNEYCFKKLVDKFQQAGYVCFFYRIPGLSYTAGSVTDWSYVISHFLRYLNKHQEFDVVVGHSLGCSLILEANEFLCNSRLLLCSPLNHNLTNYSKKMLKYLRFLPIIKRLPLPSAVIFNFYVKFMSLRNDSKIDLNLINGFYTCHAISAIKLLKQATLWEFKPRGMLRNECYIIVGSNDRLVLDNSEELMRRFECCYVYTKDCGHDTYNYINIEEVV